MKTQANNLERKETMSEILQISLAAARVNAGLTQADVAEEFHVSKSTIVKWEKGQVIPKPAEFEKLCRTYKIPADNIILPTP